MTRELRGHEVVLLLAAAALACIALASGHQSWVHTAILVGLIVGYVVDPMLVLVHELGHAIAAVALTGRRARIQIGEPPFALRFAVGAIDIDYAPRGVIAHCKIPEPAALTSNGWLIVALAGPGASLLIGIGLAVAAVGQPDNSGVLYWVLALSGGSSILIGIANAIPFRRLPSWWPGAMEVEEEGPSDGYLARLALRGQLPGASAVPAPGPRVMSERTRRVVSNAGEAARVHGSAYVGTEHLLFALAAEPGGVAADVLRSSGIASSTLQAMLQRHDHPRVVVGDLFLSPAAKRALYRARDTLTLRGDQQIDTEHLLLALTQEPEVTSAQFLVQLGVDPSAVRHRVLETLQQTASQARPEPT